MYISSHEFEWDADKAFINRRKHGIDFADAIAVFEDPLALTKQDSHPGEARFVTMGRDRLDRLVIVIWTPRRRRVRIISARRATAPELRRYAEGYDAEGV